MRDKDGSGYVFVRLWLAIPDIPGAEEVSVSRPITLPSAVAAASAASVGEVIFFFNFFFQTFFSNFFSNCFFISHPTFETLVNPDSPQNQEPPKP